MPPRRLFKSGSAEMIENGSKSYYCTTDSSPANCIVYASAGASPLASIMSVYDAATYVDNMKSWQGIMASGIAGFHLRFSAETFAGQPSQCATWQYQETAKYCVTDKGLLAYVGGTSSSGTESSFELTNYSASPSTSDFDLPKGATFTTIP
jgi:hypothetical protein